MNLEDVDVAHWLLESLGVWSSAARNCGLLDPILLSREMVAVDTTVGP